MNFKIYSFFSGAGFLDLGFERAGFEIMLVNEYSPAFMSIYKYAREQMGINPPKHGYFNCDINCFLKGLGRKKLNLLIQDDKKDGLVGFIGGPPCPDFSIAGKNEGITGENGRLTTSYKNLILREMPDFFVFENVKGLWSTKKHREEYEKLKASFKRKGYLLIDKLVNSLEYGVPQERERVILFGIHKELCNKTPNEIRELFSTQFNWGNNMHYSATEIKAMNWPKQSPFQENVDTQCPEGVIKELTIEYWFKKNEVYTHPNANDYFLPRQGKEKMATICEGDVSKKSFKRLHRWRYSPTVAYGNNEVHLHPYKSRRLSVAEALALQSLPSGFVINPILSLTDKFKTIGNGVPYLMSNAIAGKIKEFLESNVDEKSVKER